jgi:hypothetical protein
MFQRYQLHWNVGHTRNPEDTPLERVPAAVPGAVQLDWPEKTDGGPMEAWLRIGQQEEQLLLRWEVPSLEANVNIAGPVVRYVLPLVAAREMVLSLRMPNTPDRDSQYTLMYVPADATKVNQRAVLNL